MSNQNLSPRVRQYRDALRAKREAKDPTKTSSGPDPFLQHGPNDLPVFLDNGGAPAKKEAGTADPVDPFNDPNWARMDTGSNSLHKFLETEVDEATILEAATDLVRANRPGVADADPDVLADAQEIVAGVLDDAAEREAVQFLSEEPRYERTDSNLECLLKFIVARYCPGQIDVDSTENSSVITFLTQQNPRLFTAPLLHEAFDALYPDGLVDLPPGIARPATAVEKRAAQTRAAGGDVQGALLYLLERMYPELERRISSGEDVFEALGDPRYAEGLFDCVMTVFAASVQGMQAGYRDTPDNRQAIADVLGNRPATFGAVVAAWQMVKQGRRPASLEEQSAAARNRVPTQDDLDDLSDEEVEDLFTGVQRNRARSLRSRIL